MFGDWQSTDSPTRKLVTNTTLQLPVVTIEVSLLYIKTQRKEIIHRGIIYRKISNQRKQK